MIEIIKAERIEQVLAKEHRQYLVGDLKMPQALEHIYDEAVEMGITRYKDFACEKPHFHPVITEYQILLSGEAKYVDLDTEQEILIGVGDVFVIRPNTKYIQKAVKGTVILFFKHPSGNDKTPIGITEQMEKWGKDWMTAW